MLTECLRKLAEIEPEKFKCSTSLLKQEDIETVFFAVLNNDGTIKGMMDSRHFTQDFYDVIFLEAFGRECETRIDWERKYDEKPYYQTCSTNINPHPSLEHIWSDICNTKLLAVESCFEAVVNTEWEKRGKK